MKTSIGPVRVRTLYMSWMPHVALLAGLGACDSSRLVAPDAGSSCSVTARFQQSVNLKLDIVFTIDDSPGMQALQEKVATQLPEFLRILSHLPDGLPDVHIGVVSSSMGAGQFANVPGCTPESSGDNAGKFIHPPSCTSLAYGQSFIIANRGVTNFAGDIGELFSCMARLGSGGCAFSQPFAATRRALEKASDPRDPDNGGFLRPDATLAVVLVTNQDDCSVPVGSDLFDPGQVSLADAYGGLHPYRCAEFGHSCNGQKPPHDLPPDFSALALENCTPAEDRGQLSPVSDFVDFLLGLKPNAKDRIFVSAVAGPTSPYVVEERSFSPAAGGTEPQPVLQHSCVGSSGGEYGFPSPRVKAWLDAFSNNAIFQSVCTDDFAQVLAYLAQPSRSLSAQCISGTVATGADGTPDCQVVRRTRNGGGVGGPTVDHHVPLCDAHQTNYPCWKLSAEHSGCGSDQSFQVCNDPTCRLRADGSGTEDVLVTCSLRPPC
ncbi:MAG: hypothetical protein H7X95_01760 [Deltaproteobacteria bacterium]|nr:hypothetical protein [Deltaproteobacteria bacterium]